MNHRTCGVAGTALLAASQLTARASSSEEPRKSNTYARISVLHPHDGKTVEFEAGYVRHLGWHREVKDPWTWFGWTIWAGERNRSFIYATFGRSAAELDNPVSPADDERDNLVNVAPHVKWGESGLYEYLPGLSRGTGVPTPATRIELTIVELKPGAAGAFETAVGAGQTALADETLWYRMVAGGSVPRYVRLRPRPSVSAILEGQKDQALPRNVDELIVRAIVEILNLRPALSYGLPPRP